MFECRGFALIFLISISGQFQQVPSKSDSSECMQDCFRCTKRCRSTTKHETDGLKCLYDCYQFFHFLVVITILLLLRLRQTCRITPLGMFVWLVTCFRVRGNTCFKVLGRRCCQALCRWTHPPSHARGRHHHLSCCCPPFVLLLMLRRLQLLCGL